MKKINNMIKGLMFIYIIGLPLISIKYSLLIDGIIGIVFFMYAIQTILDQKYKVEFLINLKNLFKDYLFLAMCVLFCIMIGSVLYSKGKSIAVKESLRFLYYIIIYFIIKTKLKKNSDIKKIFAGYYLALIYMCTLGIYQFVFKKADVFLNSLGVPRIQATMENTNTYGAFLILVLFPLLSLTIRGRKKIRYLSSIGVVLVFINIILTFSRNAWLVMGIGLTIFIIVYSWKFIFPFMGIGILAIANPKVYGRILQFKDGTQNEGRITIWKTAFKMIKDNPILGIGNGNFEVRYNEYIQKYPYLKLKEADILPTHNSYIKIQCEVGILGLISLFCILGLAIKKVVVVIKQYKDNKGYFYSGFLISVICFYIMNLFDNFMFIPKVTGVFWIIIAIAESLIYNKRSFNRN